MVRRKTSVLVVEDNLGDARLIQEYLRESQTIDASIEIVSTLAGAVEIMRDHAFDIVLLDLSLSDSSGLGSVRLLTRTAPTTPIVVLSGNEDYKLILESVQVGAQDYLPKQDVSTNSLSRAISSAIERQAMLVERETLASIGRTISSNLDIDVVFGSFAEQVRTLLPVDRMMLSWGDEDDSVLVHRHMWNDSSIPFDDHHRYVIPVQSWETFSTVGQGTIGWGSEHFGAASSSELEERFAENGFTSAMVTPLRAGDSTNGVLIA